MKIVSRFAVSLLAFSCACTQTRHQTAKNRGEAAVSSPRPHPNISQEPILDSNQNPNPNQDQNQTLNPNPSIPVGPSEGQVSNPVADNSNIPSASAACYKADDFICQAELACLQQTNVLRGNRPALQQSVKFAFIARMWSAAQAQRGNIGHSGFPNARERAYEAEFGSGSSYGIFAENVAYSGGDDRDPNAIASIFTDMWWNSRGHRENMIGNYQVMGCGIWKSGNEYYATQIFGEE